MILKTIDLIGQILNLIVVGISVVERPGQGPDKKAEAIDIIQKMAESVLPDWLVKLLLNDTTLGVLIDYVVGRLNNEKIFEHS